MTLEADLKAAGIEVYPERDIEAEIGIKRKRLGETSAQLHVSDIPPPSGEVLTFRYLPVGHRAEAGAGADNEYPDHENWEEMYRSRAELARFGLSGAGLAAFFVSGPSMEPEIRANTPALMTPLQDFESSGIYVLTLDRWTIVKMVDLLAGGAIRLSSLNKEVNPEAEILIPVEDADTPNTYRSQLTGLTTTVRVHGRVVLYTKVT